MAFNVLDFVQGSVYPSREATVYLDGNALSRIQSLSKKLDEAPAKEQAAIKKEIRAHREALDKSKLTFHVQGFAPHVRQSITESVKKEGEKHKWTDNEIQEKVTNRVFAAAIKKVVNADGEADEHDWTADEIETLMNTAPNGALKDFISAVVHVTAESLDFDDSVDIPF